MMRNEKMKAAILGWGSLLWDENREFDEQHEAWQHDGPMLKIEFSRISTSRQGALTLVVDDANGSLIAVAWCLSTRRTVEDAICDLRCREGTTLENIGCVRLGNRAAPPPEQNTIADWAAKKNLDAVIWTALKSNFPDKTGNPFSVQNAVTYVQSLSPGAKSKAAEYVWRAPNFVQTPLRTALQQEPWFAKPE